MKKLMIIVATAMMAVMVLAACGGDDDEQQLNKLPTGQWIYEGQWLDLKHIDAVVFSFSGSEEAPSLETLARSVVDGRWYWYPSDEYYIIDTTTGAVHIGGKTFTYRLTDTTLTLTINGQQYAFKRTSGIKIDVKAYPPATDETGE